MRGRLAYVTANLGRTDKSRRDGQISVGRMDALALRPERLESAHAYSIVLEGPHPPLSPPDGGLATVCSTVFGPFASLNDTPAAQWTTSGGLYNPAAERAGCEAAVWRSAVIGERNERRNRPIRRRASERWAAFSTIGESWKPIVTMVSRSTTRWSARGLASVDAPSSGCRIQKVDDQIRRGEVRSLRSDVFDSGD